METGAIIILLLCSGVLEGTPEGGPTKTPNPCGDQGSVEVVGARTLADGGLQASNGVRFPPGCSWISHPPGSPFTIHGCPSKVKPCIWQCCPDGESLNEEALCQRSNVPLLPIRPSSSDKFDIDNFHVLKGNPCSKDRYFVDTSEPFSITERGMLIEMVESANESGTVDPGWFCVETSEDKSVVIGCEEEEDWVPPRPLEKSNTRFIVYSVLRIVTLPFLVATVVVYAVIPELRNLHGKCLMSHVGTLTVAYLFLLITQLGGRHIPKWLCLTSAFCVYYFTLVNFFWLNVMSFDIWYTFRGCRSLMGRKGERELKEFLRYSLYAWGAGFIMLCVLLTMQFSPDISDTVMRPQFGVKYCWFISEKVNFAYFEGPVLAIVLINAVFFALTAYNIFKIKKDTALLSGTESARSNLKRNNEIYVLYLKLFVVMGVPWTLNLIIWAAVDGALSYYWVPLELLNIVQGIPIFIIFVWKPSVRKLLKERWCKKQPQTPTASTAPTTSTSASGSSIPMT